MKPLFASALAVALALATLPSRANTPDPAYEQTRDWVVASITQFAGYTSDSAAVTYKDVSMDACQLRFTTLTTTPAGYTDAATFDVSLDSLNSVLWGMANDPARGYVLFTTMRPISFSKQSAPRISSRQLRSITTSTTVAALEFGQPGSDVAQIASHMRAALLRASSLCQVQLASK
jgi:hypothetical protein